MKKYHMTVSYTVIYTIQTWRESPQKYNDISRGMPLTSASTIRENSVFFRFIVVLNRFFYCAISLAQDVFLLCDFIGSRSCFSIVRFHWLQSNLESRAKMKSRRTVHVSPIKGFLQTNNLFFNNCNGKHPKWPIREKWILDKNKLKLSQVF